MMLECYMCGAKGYNRKFIIKRICKRCNGTGEIKEFKIIGVCLGWDFLPHICREDGTYLPSKYERMRYPDYFTSGDWPTDPKTGEKLPIAKTS